ncbi:hypothetical protein Ancab_011859 [Ancistrocladus abbreviatus]
MNMMKESSICPGDEIDYHNGYEFDPETDFAEFLEVAKRYADNKKSHEERSKKQQSGNKRSKKSWKTALFSFWRREKKGQPHIEAEQPRDTHFPWPNPKRRGHTSGPLHQKKETVGSRHHRPTSGPINNLLSTGIPYVSLEKLTRPQDDEAFGPIYKVT